MPAPVVSIITPTFRRAKDLWRLLEAVRLQQWGDGLIEHLVVPDGPPERATQTVLRAFPAEERIRRRSVPLPESQGQFGAACKDAGLREATGRYVVFWDDDNWFYPHALACLLALASEAYPIVVAQLRHNRFRYEPVPSVARWEQDDRQFRLGNIDTGCFLIERNLARRAEWSDQQGPGSDFRYFERVVQAAGGYDAVLFEPTVIGVHL